MARRLGFETAFGYRGAADIFREHAALSAFENDGTRDFDIGALAALSDTEFDRLDPVQWPARAGQPRQEQRFFANGGFYTPDGKARFIAPEPPALKEDTSAAFPLRLNTGRIRDQWHTMTRSGLSPRLATHLPEPFVESIRTTRPQRPRPWRLREGRERPRRLRVKVMVSKNQRRGSLFVPIHWSGETASAARVGELVSPQTDPHSGQPEAKATPVAIAPVSYSLRGFTQTHRSIRLPEGTWWARVATGRGLEFRLATNHGPMVWHDFAFRSLGSDARLAEAIEGESYRAAAFVDGELDGVLHLAPADGTVHPDLPALVPTDFADDITPAALVTNVAIGEPVVCACFQVDAAAIRAAVANGARTVAQIGRCCGQAPIAVRACRS